MCSHIHLSSLSGGQLIKSLWGLWSHVHCVSVQQTGSGESHCQYSFPRSGRSALGHKRPSAASVTRGLWSSGGGHEKCAVFAQPSAVWYSVPKWKTLKCTFICHSTSSQYNTHNNDQTQWKRWRELLFNVSYGMVGCKGCWENGRCTWCKNINIDMFTHQIIACVCVWGSLGLICSADWLRLASALHSNVSVYVCQIRYTYLLSHYTISVCVRTNAFICHVMYFCVCWHQGGVYMWKHMCVYGTLCSHLVLDLDK